MKVGVSNATQSAPVTFMVDAGDGTMQNFTANGSELPGADNVTVTGGAEVTVYMPEGSDITALAIDGYPMKSIDLDQARSLSALKLNSTGLQTIDLTWNRCLRDLDLSHNMLKTLDLTGASGYGKNVLSNLDASYNSLTSFYDPALATLYTLDLSNNKLTEISLDAASNISVMNLSNNLLEAVDLEDMEAIATLDVSHNNLTALPIASYNPLVYLDLSYNNIAMPNLPSTKRVASYIYAPQSEVLLPELAPTVNLTSQWLDENCLYMAQRSRQQCHSRGEDFAARRCVDFRRCLDRKCILRDKPSAVPRFRRQPDAHERDQGRRASDKRCGNLDADRERRLRTHHDLYQA